MPSVSRLIGVVSAAAPFALILVIGVLNLQLPTLTSSIPRFAARVGMFGYACFICGTVVCGSNFCFTFLHYPLHRLLFRGAEFHWISPVPILGTILLVTGFFAMPHVAYAGLLSLLMLSLDTGGPLWFVICVWHDDSFWRGTSFK
jgi:hypothetical protein